MPQDQAAASAAPTVSQPEDAPKPIAPPLEASGDSLASGNPRPSAEAVRDDPPLSSASANKVVPRSSPGLATPTGGGTNTAPTNTAPANTASAEPKFSVPLHER